MAGPKAKTDYREAKKAFRAVFKRQYVVHNKTLQALHERRGFRGSWTIVIHNMRVNDKSIKRIAPAVHQYVGE